MVRSGSRVSHRLITLDVVGTDHGIYGQRPAAHEYVKGYLHPHMNGALQEEDTTVVQLQDDNRIADIGLIGSFLNIGGVRRRGNDDVTAPAEKSEAHILTFPGHMALDVLGNDLPDCPLLKDGGRAVRCCRQPPEQTAGQKPKDNADTTVHGYLFKLATSERI